jgi:hypothetical protein
MAGQSQERDWHTLRQRGRLSRAAKAVPIEVDVRRGRPPAPNRLSAEERHLWERLTFSRRPGWFSGGGESLLESLVHATIHCQRLEAVLRELPVTGEDFQKLSQTHRATVALACTLATRLRLSPSSHIDKRLPHDGDLPLSELDLPPRLMARPRNDDIGDNANGGERRLADLLAAHNRERARSILKVASCSAIEPPDELQIQEGEFEKA